MSRFIRRPSNMPRMFRGRMFNRRTGGYAPAGYSGFRPRRATHSRFQTQTSPYGAGGGGRSQFHGGHSGHAGNVYAAMLHHARNQGGMNMGRTAHTPGYRGTRMHRGFRQDQASIKRHFSNKIREQKKLMRGRGANVHQIRGEIARLRGEHRTQRRAHAQGINTKWARGHDFNLGGGKRRQWRPRKNMLSPRMGINVGQDSYTGRRFIQGLNFRRQQGGGQAGYDRARARNMRIANRMRQTHNQNYRKGKWVPDEDMRLHGGQRKTGPRYGLPATRADFTRGGRRRGFINVGNHANTGRYAGMVRRTAQYPASSSIRGTRPTVRSMGVAEKQRASGRHAPWAREFIRNQNPNRSTDRYINYNMGTATPTYQGWMNYNFNRINRP